MNHAHSYLAAGIAALAFGFSGVAHADPSGDKPFNAYHAAQTVAAQGNVVVVPNERTEPAHDTVVVRRNTPMIVSGLVTFGLAYGISAGIAAGTDSDANDRLYVPLVGPWLSMADRPDCPVESESCDGETTKKVFLAVDGIVQGAGLLTFFYGLLNPLEGRQVDVAGAQVSKLRVNPVAVEAGGGLALSGWF